MDWLSPIIYDQGGNGGGLLKLTANALYLNGANSGILADGASGAAYGGGGSGGGVWINIGTLSGIGTISAKGGTSTVLDGGGAGGGGGRIAIYYTTNNLPVANISAAGGKYATGATAPKKGGCGVGDLGDGCAGTIDLFSQNLLPLTLARSGAGTGIVHSTPAGITCGTTCSGNFPKNSSVILSATPDSGSVFSGWSGACSDSGSCTLIMDAPKAATASFSLISPPVVIITSPVGITKNNRPLLQYSVSAGTVVVKVDGVVTNKLAGNTLDLLTDGTHTVRVEANNGVMVYAESTVTIDTIAPTVTVTALPAIVKVVTQTLSGTVEAGSSVSVSVTTGTALLGIVTYPTATTWQCVVSNLTLGTNSFTITANDPAGNSSQAFASVSYALPVTLELSVPTIAADFQGAVILTVSIDPAGTEVLVEQLVDANENGEADAGDYVIRSFNMTDGVAAANPNIQGDTDLAVNGIITTALNYFLTSDLYHAPGHYLFRATSGIQSAVVPFTVSSISQSHTIAGMATDGANPIAGAMVQLTDKWLRHVAYVVADTSGNYLFNLKRPGEYNLLPVAYGYVATTTPVTLAASQNIENLNLNLTAGTYHLAGKVKDVTGASIAGVWILASDGNNSGIAMTDSNGDYDLLLPSGQYSVGPFAGAVGPGPFAKGYHAYNKPMLAITVDGNMAATDITLAVGDIPASGRVLDVIGNPVPGLAVLGKLSIVSEPVSFSIADANGAFTLGLSLDNPWSISLDQATAQTLGYIGTVHSNLTIESPFSEQDLVVQPITSWVQGVVKNSANQLLSRVEVKLRNTDSSIIASGVTATDGTYSLGAFAGNWFIDALTENQGTHPVTEQAFTLVDGQTTSIDFTVIDLSTIVINSGAAFTNNLSATLNLSSIVGDGVSEMQFSNDQVSWSDPETFALSKDWTLSSGDGTKTVYARFRNALGWSAAVVKGTILLDTISPTSLASPVGGTYNSAQSVTLSCADGTGSGCDKIYYTLDGTTPTTASSVYTSPLNIAATSTVSYLATDKAGNPEAVKTAAYNIASNLTIDTITLATGLAYGNYSQTLSASGGSGVYDWSIVDGYLPGLALDHASGVIAGIPSYPGTFSFQVRITDSHNPTAAAWRDFTIQIVDPIRPIVTITSPAADMVYPSAPLLQFGVVSDQNSSVSIKVLVDGKVVQNSSGSILDLPAGRHSLLVEAINDLGGDSGFASVGFTVGTPPVQTNVSETFETGDFSKLPWVLNGDRMWSVIDGAGYGQTKGAVPPALLEYGESAALSLTHFFNSAGGVIVFKGGGPLFFYIDDVRRYSGSVVTPGFHKLKWEYKGMFAEPAWLDNVQLNQLSKKVR